MIRKAKHVQQFYVAETYVYYLKTKLLYYIIHCCTSLRQISPHIT